MNPDINGTALKTESMEEASNLLGTTDHESEQASTPPPSQPATNPWVTRTDALNTAETSRKPLFLLGGAVGAAVLLFVLTTFVGKTPRKQSTAQQSNATQRTVLGPPKGSVTPLMDTMRTPTNNDVGGELTAADISRTRTSTGAQATSHSIAPLTHPVSQADSTLASVPPFDATQQQWEEPKPYDGARSPSQTSAATPSPNLLKEASLVFVKKTEVANTSPVKSDNDDTAPQLNLTPGTRIQARLETQVSSATAAPVVAVVEYTYSLGEHVVIPAGARVYGQLQQADRSGAVSIKFNEMELLDGNRMKIDAIGTSLELGPIKGTVSGKNTGRNFLVRTASGIGSVAAMLVGNNSSSAFSEDDLIRQRIAENAGNAGDTEIMDMALTNRLVVSIPADTPIYIVFTKRDTSAATSHPSSSATP